MTEGPWYISARAVREYGRLQHGRTPDDESDLWWQCEEELFALAAAIVARYAELGRLPRRLPGGLLQYRGPKRARHAYLVTPTPQEGPLPALVSVRPGHAARGPRPA